MKESHRYAKIRNEVNTLGFKQSHNTYTGIISYRDIDFTFVFINNELRLIPPADKEGIIAWQWKMKSIGKGEYTFADPIPVDEKFIVAYCNETNMKIVFLPELASNLRFNNNVVIIDVSAYIVCKSNKDLVNRVAFSCPEINYIHPTNQAFTIALSHEEWSKKGIVWLNTNDVELSTTETQKFTVDDKEIQVHFGISRNVSTKISNPPLSLKSIMYFDFDATDDFEFVLKLWQIARDFVRFLCYRNNIFFTEIKLCTPKDDDKHELFANMYIIDDVGEIEEKPLQEERIIKQLHIAGKEGEILTDIASDSIYLRHIPDTYQSGRHINAARFVMITAAFEWEFKRLYPDGIKKSENTIIAENEVSEEIQHLIDNTTGKKKKILKFLHRLVRSDSLQTEIVQIGKDFSTVIDIFGNYLYRINDAELNYSNMGQRLSSQRNHFAHGDLDKDFIDLSLLDLIFLENIVYAMQLKYYDVDDKEIQRAIKELFRYYIDIDT